MSIKNHVGTSLVVQWLTLQVPNAGGPGFIPHQGTRAHMLQLQPAATAAKLNFYFAHNFSSTVNGTKT